MTRLQPRLFLLGLVLGLFAILWPVAAPAAEPMGAGDFEAYVTGHTVTYAHQGRVYGMEQYLPGRRVVWRHLGGECRVGTWFETAEGICFQYEESLPLQCWQFYNDGGRLGARASDDPAGSWLYEVKRTSDPMICPDPYLGA